MRLLWELVTPDLWLFMYFQENRKLPYRTLAEAHAFA